jgi:hypothetical protein
MDHDVGHGDLFHVVALLSGRGRRRRRPSIVGRGLLRVTRGEQNAELVQVVVRKDLVDNHVLGEL